ncbi:MAG: hypothetical protein KAT16_07215, partial [Candidatus Heimdallarchaeota archaeon]|nr:hypothetical protein [Candidatus Heimdallarchaeota archaeon]
METSQRRLYLNNWAIVSTSSEIMWSFGDINEEKQRQTLDFIIALSKLGREVWDNDQAIGMIRLRYPTPHPSHAREIMIITLHNKFNIVISDPLVTTRLITKINFDKNHSHHYDTIRSILAGSASVIYSQFYSSSSLLEHSVVDKLFLEAIQAVTYNKKVTVGNGECSFSALTVEELLFFHALLKKLFESYSYSKNTNKSRPWGVIHSNSGAQIYLEHESPVDSALLSAFSAVTAAYCNLLFSAQPARLVFGYNEGMEFITTKDNIFVINNPQKLLKLQRFIRNWKKVPREVQLDLVPAMKSYFSELSLIEERQRLKSLEFHQVINRLTHMGIRRARSY